LDVAPWATDGATVDRFLDLIEPPAWHADAACAEHPELPWFPKVGQPTGPAKAVCARCLVGG
jgi:hypothetical protein